MYGCLKVARKILIILYLQELRFFPSSLDENSKKKCSFFFMFFLGTNKCVSRVSGGGARRDNDKNYFLVLLNVKSFSPVIFHHATTDNFVQVFSFIPLHCQKKKKEKKSAT